MAYVCAGGKKVTLSNTVTAHIIGRKNTDIKAVKVKMHFYSLNKGKMVAVKARTVLVSPGKKQLTNAHAKQIKVTVK